MLQKSRTCWDQSPGTSPGPTAGVGPAAASGRARSRCLRRSGRKAAVGCWKASWHRPRRGQEAEEEREMPREHPGWRCEDHRGSGKARGRRS